VDAITVVRATFGLASSSILPLVLGISFAITDDARLLLRDPVECSDNSEAREDVESFRAFFERGSGSKLKINRSFLSL
jgi:hypothetical protein